MGAAAMSKYFVTANIDRPTDDWRKPRTWYKVLAVIIATPCSLIWFFAFSSLGVLPAGIAGIIIWILSIRLGIKGGIIGNRIRHMLQPKSIRVKDPTPGELFSLRLYWALRFQLTGIIIGSVFITMLISMFFAH